jgi:dipeptidyl aminopeptidase/acylaminoacyl peptidase
MKKTLALFAILSVAVFGSIAANAQNIIGSEYGGYAVYQIDSTTGNFVTLGAPAASKLPGLAYNPTTDTLYGTDENNLYTVNRTNGATTLVGAHNFRVTGLTFNGAHTLMYAIGYDGNLYSINPATGAATSIGPHNRSTILDLATDSNGTVYAAGFGSGLYTVNTSTGATTQVGTITGLYNAATGITFSSEDILYAIDISTDRLLIININTLVSTEVGTASIGSDVRGLAYIGDATNVSSAIPVPALSTMALLVLALILLITGWVATGVTRKAAENRKL